MKKVLFSLFLLGVLRLISCEEHDNNTPDHDESNACKN